MWGLSLFLLGLSITTAVSDHILLFHHVASYSHRVQTFPLAEELVKRGHEVTFLSPYYPKEPNPNITEIVPQKLAEYIVKELDKDFEINLRVQHKMDQLKDKVYDLAYGACEALFKSPEFKKWLKKTNKVDLVIIDNCMPDCGIGVAYKLEAKYALFSTVTVIGHEYDTIGFLPETSVIPELEVYSQNTPLNFLERVSNEVNTLRWRWAHLQYSRKADLLIRKSLNVPKMPFIGDLFTNVSLVLYTGDTVTDYPRALPPLYVNIAGIHCKTPEKSSLPVNQFFNTFKAFPNLKFLWKWNGEFPKDIPENVFLSRWFPQLDLLAHPRIRGFVTQSGRPSAMEALWNGVPMIAFPILGDQDFNANRINQMGGNVKLEIGTVTSEQLIAAVNKLVYEPSMKLQIQKLQKIFRDRPMTPVDTAAWWTEYILRTEDTSHLRPTGNHQYWFQRRQVDVWLFLFAVILVSISPFVLLAFITARRVWKEMKGEMKLKAA
ncbi:UDP-glucuronosyltransferase 1-9 [Orchesella cincta]|uniref:UDP-glucuronosyltransferase n=1 Tax=Orchesella cincta TaxID=48709 RepID=A0A1D2MSA9_ORCCI|nr:UDP-glucuronosyltransferase 1-9 [Orchesella cincta]